MEIVFLPYPNGPNPYQGKLAAALAYYGVNVHSPGHPPLRKLIERRRQGRLDLVHLHWATPLLLSRRKAASLAKSCLLLLVCMALRASGTGLVWTVHNLTGHESRQNGLETFGRRILCRVCHHIIVHCPEAVGLVMHAYRFPPKMADKISAIPHGHFIDHYPNRITQSEARQSLGLSSNRRIWLYFGLIRPYKNVSKLVEIFKQTAKNDAYLLIAGEPQCREIKTGLLRQITGQDRIQARLEFIPDDQIQTYFKATDLVVLPFSNILTSSSLMLAMSFARAVVTPGTGCSVHLLDRQPQLLYPPDSEKGLEQCLQSSLLSDLDALGRQNLARARYFPWESSAEKTYRLYQRCLDGDTR